MANRNFPSNKLYGFHVMPAEIDGNFAVGSTGAVGALSQSPGVKSVTRLGTGTYQIQLQDNYNSFISLDTKIQSPTTGSEVIMTNFVQNTIYQITTLGTATTAQWVTAGVPAGITPAVGVVFKAAAATPPTNAASKAKALGVSGVSNTEIIGASNTMSAITPSTPGSGAFITFQCLGPTSSSVTTSIPTDPASGSVMYFKIKMNNSAIQ